ncbi:MAG: hypothetical protein M1828_002862 [Chrysothrix sp. TS-e1954]|nr:MAG: hypothetical protein M1828_002862 [Chrysothrix sp. TS-e1954]
MASNAALESHDAFNNNAGPKTGLSMYAALLDPSAASTTISKAPILFKEHDNAQSRQHEDTATETKQHNAALRFQPARRPQASLAKVKSRPVAAAQKIDGLSSRLIAVDNGGLPSVAKSTLEDWAAAFQAEDLPESTLHEGAVKRQRGGRKRRRREKEVTTIHPQDWDDIYDPLRPNRYEDYKQSEEKDRDIRDWRARLQSFKSGSLSNDSSSSGISTPSNPDRVANGPRQGFAPPLDLDTQKIAGDGRSAHPTIVEPGLNDATGDDAYARRMHLSQIAQATDATVPVSHEGPNIHDADVMRSSHILPHNQMSSTIQPPSDGTVSRAPVRYALSAPQPVANDVEVTQEHTNHGSQDEVQADEETSGPRSVRPGQRGFAERMMAKQGWTKGSGLGAEGAGMRAPLRVQIEKRKKRSDADGGGWVGPAGKGKIVGNTGNMHQGLQDHVTASDVVVLRGLMDRPELEVSSDTSFVQELGEHLAEKCGVVERVLLHPDTSQAFVKFSSQTSAIRV